MNKNELIKKINGTANKIGFKFKKHSPEILIIMGVGGTVVSAVMACVATTKINNILDDSKEKIDTIHKSIDAQEKIINNCVMDDKNECEFTVCKETKKELSIVYVQTAYRIAKLYAPSIFIGTLSLTSIITSHNILRKRNMAIAAAYTAIDTSFKDYRKRVVERFGEDVDKELRYNIKTKTIKEVEIDENGNEKIVEKEVKVIDENLKSDYAVYFDSSATGWVDDHDYNLTFLKGQQYFANDKLKADGFCFLNDVYYLLGLPKTKVGQVVGWLYRPDDPDYKGDGFIDFETKEVYREDENGNCEKSILLNFNVDGYILDSI